MSLHAHSIVSGACDGGEVDAHLVELNARVATLADAWLATDRDDDVLQRLETAVARRRAYLQPALLPA